jgi:hypothetical protein
MAKTTHGWLRCQLPWYESGGNSWLLAASDSQPFLKPSALAEIRGIDGMAID